MLPFENWITPGVICIISHQINSRSPPPFPRPKIFFGFRILQDQNMTEVTAHKKMFLLFLPIAQVSFDVCSGRLIGAVPTVGFRSRFLCLLPSLSHPLVFLPPNSNLYGQPRAPLFQLGKRTRPPTIRSIFIFNTPQNP